MKLLYFAWVRSRTGVAEEEISLPDGVTDVSSLIEWLKARGAGYSAAFADLKAIRVAVNQEYMGFDAPVRAGDEIAFFPPMTGG